MRQLAVIVIVFALVALFALWTPTSAAQTPATDIVAMEAAARQSVFVFDYPGQPTTTWIIDFQWSQDNQSLYVLWQDAGVDLWLLTLTVAPPLVIALSVVVLLPLMFLRIRRLARDRRHERGAFYCRRCDYQLKDHDPYMRAYCPECGGNLDSRKAVVRGGDDMDRIRRVVIVHVLALVLFVGTGFAAMIASSDPAVRRLQQWHSAPLSQWNWSVGNKSSFQPLQMWMSWQSRLEKLDMFTPGARPQALHTEKGFWSQFLLYGQHEKSMWQMGSESELLEVDVTGSSPPRRIAARPTQVSRYFPLSIEPEPPVTHLHWLAPDGQVMQYALADGRVSATAIKLQGYQLIRRPGPALPWMLDYVWPSGDGRLFVTQDFVTMKTYDITSGQPLSTIRMSPGQSVQYCSWNYSDPDRLFVLLPPQTNGQREPIRIHDTRTGNLTRTISLPHTQGVSNYAASWNARYIYLHGDFGGPNGFFIYVWDEEQRDYVEALQLSPTMYAPLVLRPSQDGKHLAALIPDGKRIALVRFDVPQLADGPSPSP